MNVAALTLPVVGERFRLERANDRIQIVRLKDELVVGSIEVEPGSDGVFIGALCVEDAYRSYGAGSEAARLLNQACAAANVPTVRAWAAPNLGLSAYFWIRMGFHPLHGEGPGGGIWFERRNSK